MSLETAQFIHQLIASNPTVKDNLKEGDDHIRMIKAVLKNTFPEIKGPVNVSHTALNNIPENLAKLLTQLISTRTHVGMIVQHDPAKPIPAGWTVCDGRTVEGYGNVPDLRDTFIRGSSVLNPAGTKGGALNPKATLAGKHKHANVEHVLTLEQIPSHTHPNPANARYVDTAGTNDGITGGPQAGHRNDVVLSTGSAGGNKPHNHEMQDGGEHVHDLELPLWYASIFIVRTEADIEL